VAADKGKIRVKYLWDTDDHRRQWLNEQHGFGAQLPDSPETCCADPEVDAIIVMTPQNARREYVEMIVPSGKTLYLDKPVAANPADVEAIWRCLLEADVTAITGFSLRYMPGFYTVKELIASGRLGEITHIRSCQHIPAAGGLNFRRKWSRKVAASGGYLNEMGVHDIDAMIWLSESIPRSVVAMQHRSLYAPRPDRPERCSDCGDWLAYVTRAD
jgi:predicted dehydrogenase